MTRIQKSKAKEWSGWKLSIFGLCCFVAGATLTAWISEGTSEQCYLRQAESLFLNTSSTSSQETESKSSSTPSCITSSSKVLADKIVIDYPKIRAQSKDALDNLKGLTLEKNEKWLLSDPGKEHYTLLHYLTKTYHDTTKDCRHVADIGTRYVASSLALSASGANVKTFDVPNSTERQMAFRGKTEDEWFEQVKQTSNGLVDIKFHNLDLLKISDQRFQNFMGDTWLILLDTHHLPDTNPFEREWFARLTSIQPKFEGIVLLDDIHLNSEMEKWWKELQESASERGFQAFDVTPVGHFSGTGLLDFSGKVEIKAL